MFDIENYEIYKIVNLLGLIVGLFFGIIGQKNQFCFSGSIKDYVLTKSTRRAGSVLMAIIVAIVSTNVITYLFDLDLTNTNFFRENINYFSIVIGGLLFGIGMMLADGCSGRHLIKFAQGDNKSLVVIIFIGIFAYASTKGILHNIVFSISTNDTFVLWSSFISNVQMNIYLVLFLLFALLAFVIKKFKRIFLLKDGIGIGLLIGISWYITGVIGSESIDRLIDITGITVVYPSAKTLELFSYYEVNNLTFSICIILGIIIGSFLMSQKNKKYSFGCTNNIKTNELKYSMIGGSLMGIGGVMAIGCTIGQGLTGLSTLAFASLLAILSIFIAGYITAVLLDKQKKLPMCFSFEWNDK